MIVNHKQLFMKKIIGLALLFSAFIFSSCENPSNEASTTPADVPQNFSGQSGVKDDQSQKNVVQVAIGSPDHSTLVKAVQAAELVDALSNAGPFTVFAPTNAAFDKLPAGTLEDLLKADKKETLADILQYHVSIGVYKAESLQDGQSLGQANGGNITITKKDDKIFINNSATLIASVQASNGIVHVIDGVLLPK